MLKGVSEMVLLSEASSSPRDITFYCRSGSS